MPPWHACGAPLLTDGKNAYSASTSGGRTRDASAVFSRLAATAPRAVTPTLSYQRGHAGYVRRRHRRALAGSNRSPAERRTTLRAGRHVTVSSDAGQVESTRPFGSVRG